MKSMQNVSAVCLPLFLTSERNTCCETNDKKKETVLSQDMIERFSAYSIENYIEDIRIIGLVKTWDNICDYVLKFGQNKGIIDVSQFGELYEMGLAISDKMQKKASGQYYTPDDVASVMGKWFNSCKGENICDVGCGTGKLILTYLDHIGYNAAIDLIKKGCIYLYDFDRTALKICKTALIVKYSIENPNCIHDIYGDFLDDNVSLPPNAKVISNPPYASIKELGMNWKQTNVLLDTKELYAAFMEKILAQSVSAVIITPFSFISGHKFFSLRYEMCRLGNGFIVAFDNVPGNIFCGKKHGIFNTNTANSVRAAITVFNRDSIQKGFKVSPLIRFKNEERSRLLTTDILEATLPNTLQIVDKGNKVFKKVGKSLEHIFNAWTKSEYKVKDVISKEETEFLIDIPNTCRYFTTGSHRKLKRGGSILLHAKNKEMFNFLYCFINSSFAYWWWRIFDGGITFPRLLLMDMPLPLNFLTDKDKLFFEHICNQMIEEESKYIITKMNAGELQENIKFPFKYREKINNKLLSIMGCKKDSDAFIPVHANHFFYDADEHSIGEMKGDLND